MNLDRLCFEFVFCFFFLFLFFFLLSLRSLWSRWVGSCSSLVGLVLDEGEDDNTERFRCCHLLAGWLTPAHKSALRISSSKDKCCEIGLGLRLASTRNHTHGGLLDAFALMFSRPSIFKGGRGNSMMSFGQSSSIKLKVLFQIHVKRNLTYMMRWQKPSMRLTGKWLLWKGHIEEHTSRYMDKTTTVR